MVKTSAQQYFDFSRSSSQILTVQTLRMALQTLVLVFTVIYQVASTSFVSFDIFFKVYLLLSFSFFLNAIYVLAFDKIEKTWVSTAALFMWEVFYVTLLIYFIGIHQSLLVFLYLINIILCAVIFQRKGGIYLALLSSVAFSVLVALDSQMQGNTMYLAVGVNNLAFFTVAYIAGFLSEQLNFMGVELKERSRDLRLLKNLNSLILENIQAGLLTVDNEGVVLQSNQKAHALLESQETFLGKSIKELTVPFFEHWKKRRESDVIDLPFLSRAGQKRTLRTRFSPLVDERGQERGLILIFEDVESLLRLEERVRQSEKLAAIGQLAAGIAHEIRNPLASISGSVQLLSAESMRSADEKKLMDIVQREIERLNKLITEFLEYARPQPLEQRSVVVRDILQESLESIKLHPLSKGVLFEVQLGDSSSFVLDPDKLKQAFLNIFLNSLQAMESSLEKKLMVQSEVQGDLWVLQISDTGCGIPEQELKRVFEPFHTTKRGGTGLGLATVHSILQSHNAQVEVKSQVKKGTTFVIQFRQKVES